MRQYRAFLVGGLGVLCGSVAACDLVAGIGTYCNGDEDPSCGKGSGGSTTSTETGGGGTGGTTAAACMPGETRGCYSGPASTRMVGTCQDGLETCNDEGTAFGSCEGEVLPGAEKPDAIGDEACDGYGAGEPIWWRTFGGTDNEEPHDVAVDTDGNVFVCGSFDGTMQLGDDIELVSQGGTDVFLAKLDPDGNVVWGKRFGDEADQTGCHVVSDRAGGVYVAGGWSGQVFFGGEVIVGAAMVARFDAAGAHLWSHSVGSFAADRIDDVAVRPSGDIAVLGSFTGMLRLDATTVTSKTGYDIYLVQYARDGGAFQWGYDFPDAGSPSDGDDFGIGLAVQGDKLGALVRITGTVIPDGPQGQTVMQSSMEFPFAVIQYSGSGVHDWHKVFEFEGSDAFDEPLDLAPDRSAGFALAVQHAGLSNDGVVVSRMAAADGATTVYKAVPIGTNPDYVRFVTNDAGDLLFGLQISNVDSITGKLLGPTAGGGGLANAAFGILHQDSAKDWSVSLGGQLGPADTQGTPAIAPAPDGGVIAAASFNTKVVFGTKALVSKGGNDVTVARFAP